MENDSDKVIDGGVTETDRIVSGKRSEKIEIRRKRVAEMLMRGVPQAVMAKKLGVHVNTIANDVRRIRQETRTRITKMDVLEEVGSALSWFDKVAEIAMCEAQGTNDKRMKIKFLDTAIKARRARFELLTEAGVLLSQIRSLRTEEMHKQKALGYDYFSFMRGALLENESRENR